MRLLDVMCVPYTGARHREDLRVHTLKRDVGAKISPRDLPLVLLNPNLTLS